MSSNIIPSGTLVSCTPSGYLPISGGYSTTSSPFATTYEPPKFTINQSSDGEWNFTIRSKNKKFIKSILKTMIEDYEDLELAETLGLMKKKSEIGE